MISHFSHKLQVTAKALCTWSNGILSDSHLQFHLVTELILRLDIAQEKRTLTEAEYRLKKYLKTRILGLATVDKARKR
ncbi:hypothetical protein E2562_031659 [Oryza meyeriana var. granulata]|uniref:Uncharacterized protein n=1 Tax=Oryza meyeriana var. granulata TaxID=110450 RepID=A0A6G1E4T8_9ORYZ|nr:hypothetical protein E2562_031659 [Oryza meyeriana var. granulata]